MFARSSRQASIGSAGTPRTCTCGACIVAAPSSLRRTVRQSGGLVPGALGLLRTPEEKIIVIDVKQHAHRQEGKQRPDAHRQLGGILPLWPCLVERFEQAGERTFKVAEGGLLRWLLCLCFP